MRHKRLLPRLAAAAAAASLAMLCMLDFATTKGSYGHAAALRWSANAPARPDLSDAARAMLAARPLAARAYVALAAGQPGATDLAVRALRQAVAVDPRLGAARYRLASHYLETNRIADGIDELRVLQNLDGRLASTLTPLVLELARVPAHRRTIATRFANHPNLLRLVEQGNRAGLEPEALIGLVSRTDLARLPNGVATAQKAIAEAYIERRQYRRAWLAWHALAGRRPSAAVFDGGFDGREGGAPFGWTLTNNQDAQTAIRAGEGPGGAGALSVEAYGSFLSTVARQNLVLAPGRHRLLFAANAGEAAETPFFWSVKCVAGNVLAELPVTASPQWRRQAAELTIPADCPMQTLALQKGPTPTEGPHRIRVANLQVLP